MNIDGKIQLNSCIKCQRSCRKEYCYRHNPDYLAKKKIKERERMREYGKTEAHKNSMRRYYLKINQEEHD